MKKQLRNMMILAVLGMVSIQTKANVDLTKINNRGEVSVVKSLKKKLNLNEVKALNKIDQIFASNSTAFYFITEAEKDEFLLAAEKVSNVLDNAKKGKFTKVKKEIAANVAIYQTIWNGQKLALENNDEVEVPQSIETYTSL